MTGHLLLRLCIWFLLTASISPANVVIGIGVALLLPRPAAPRERLRDLLRALGRVVCAIPRAYLEALHMIILPHGDTALEKAAPEGRPSPGLIFLEIFRITLTPKAVVTAFRKDAGLDIHRICRKKRPCS